MSRYSIIACSASIARPEQLARHGRRCASRRSAYGSGGDVEQLGERLAALDLDEQHLPAAGGEREGQRGGDRRLAGAALAGDDVQPCGPRRDAADDQASRAGARRVEAGDSPVGWSTIPDQRSGETQ